MSQPHQIAIVPVTVSIWEPVQLADIMGRVPVREMAEVLETQWALARNWERVEAGHLYRRRISADVTLEVRLDADERVTFQRYTESVPVESTEAAAVRQGLQGKIQEAADAYSLAVNELISEAVVRALPVRLKELHALAGEPVITHTAQYTEIICHVEMAA